MAPSFNSLSLTTSITAILWSSCLDRGFYSNHIVHSTGKFTKVKDATKSYGFEGLRSDIPEFAGKSNATATTVN